MKSERLELTEQILRINLTKFDKSIILLRDGFETAQKIGLKDQYSSLELEKYDSLTSRFARATDILTQKVLKSFFIFLQEDYRTFIDLTELSEKFNIVSDSKILLTLRNLRNHIAHEYEEEELNSLFSDVIRFTPDLILISEQLSEIMNKYLKF